MGNRLSRHERETRREIAIYLSISFAVAFAAIVAAVVARTADTAPAAAAPQHVAAASVPAPDQPISQEGRLVSVTPTSVTAQGADGVPRTYVVDGQTNAITPAGSQVGAAGTAFAVNDEVQIVGVVRGGTAIATAVAHRDVSQLAGPPMDYALP